MGQYGRDNEEICYKSSKRHQQYVRENHEICNKSSESPQYMRENHETCPVKSTVFERE